MLFIVFIRAVTDCHTSVGMRQLLQLGEEQMLAKVAAVDRILQNLWILKFVYVDDSTFRLELFCHCDSGLDLRVRVQLCLEDDSKHRTGGSFAGYLQKQSTVYTTGVCDSDSVSVQCLELFSQTCIVLCEFG